MCLFDLPNENIHFYPRVVCKGFPRTQLAAISMTSEIGKPLSVFLGEVAALALVTLIGVAFGSALMQFVPEEYLKKAAASLFVLIGILMWFKVV